jgi:hypothetical protein
MLLAPLAEAGACKPLPSSLASQTKNVSARWFVQESDAPAWIRAAARDSRRSQRVSGQSLTDPLNNQAWSLAPG